MPALSASARRRSAAVIPLAPPPTPSAWHLPAYSGDWAPASCRSPAARQEARRRRARLARELSAHAGRPTIYNLVTQPIERPDEWQEHLRWLEDSFKSGARCYGSCVSVVAGPIFDLRLGLDVPQDEDLTNPNSLFAGMPTWDRVMALPYGERMRAFRDPAVRKSLSAEAVEGTVAQERPGTDRRGRARGFFNRRWDLVQVFMTQHARNRGLEGKSVTQIAEMQGKSVMDAFLDLSLDEELQTFFIGVDRNNDPAAQKQILGSPYTVIGTSDGGARPHSADRHEYSTHLLGHWVREQQVMTLEEAVHRLTGRTALMHDMHDRGIVAAGKVADLVIFDPDTIASKPREPVNDLPAGGVRVKRDAVGIDYVVVNGTVLLDKGELTDALPGQIVRGPLYQAATRNRRCAPRGKGLVSPARRISMSEHPARQLHLRRLPAAERRGAARGHHRLLHAWARSRRRAQRGAGDARLHQRASHDRIRCRFVRGLVEHVGRSWRADRYRSVLRRVLEHAGIELWIDQRRVARSAHRPAVWLALPAYHGGRHRHGTASSAAASRRASICALWWARRTAGSRRSSGR